MAGSPRLPLGMFVPRWGERGDAGGAAGAPARRPTATGHIHKGAAAPLSAGPLDGAGGRLAPAEFRQSLRRWTLSFSSGLMAEGRQSGLGKGPLLTRAGPAGPGGSPLPSPSLHTPEPHSILTPEDFQLWLFFQMALPWALPWCPDGAIPKAGFGDSARPLPRLLQGCQA